MLASGPGTGYIHELFTPFTGAQGFFRKPFENWFLYITDDNADRYYDYFESMLGFKYPTHKIFQGADSLRLALRATRDQAIFIGHRLRRDIPILKDAAAFFSAPWLSNAFGMRVLITIRHPAAFYSSLKAKNWNFDFRVFADQPALMADRLSSFEDPIQDRIKSEPDLLSEAILVWNCIYSVTAAYQREHPEWQFVRHEDLSADPQREFSSLFDLYGLPFTPEVQAEIHKTSSAKNPTIPQNWRETSTLDVRRNSAGNVATWKQRLAPEEIQRIREGTAEVASSFYSDSDW